MLHKILLACLYIEYTKVEEISSILVLLKELDLAYYDATLTDSIISLGSLLEIEAVLEGK